MSRTEPYTGPFPRGRHSHRCKGCGDVNAVACYKAKCTRPQTTQQCGVCVRAIEARLKQSMNRLHEKIAANKVEADAFRERMAKRAGQLDQPGLFDGGAQ